jgi:SAM-dependent methyltransferase
MEYKRDMTKYADIIYPPDEGNTYPHKFIEYIYNRFYANENKEFAKILDIGCSTGKALRLFSNHGNLELYGIDVRDEGSEGFEYKRCDLESESIPYPDNYFDFIYTKSVLEHVFNTENFIKESLRVLKPGGVLVALAPDWASQQSIYWDDYTHVKPFTRKGLRDCLIINGFENAGCEYFYQLPFVWRHPWLSIIPKIISLLPDSLKWKDSEQRNTKDRKLVRFSKEIMLLSYGVKPKSK